MTAHDLGRHLHCYGAASVSSPNLDALAAEGVRFDQAFATAPQCSPSRASLATGMYPHNNGVMGLAHEGFDWELATPHAAALFAAMGYETYLFGNQHVTLHPERLGFEHIHSPGHEHGNATGMEVASAVAELFAERDSSAPLFVEINFDDTHRPYPEAGAAPSRKLTVPGYLPPIPETFIELAGAEAAIHMADAAVGRVLDAIDRAGRGDSTLVVFTTDHGLPMPRAKCTLYDPGIEIALMMRWPDGGLAGGRVADALVSNIDILPTLLEAAGATAPRKMQGASLAQAPRDAVFAEKTFHSYYDPMRCIRTRTHKFIRNFEAAFAVEVPGDVQRGPIFRADPSRYSADRQRLTELYDLEADPLEQRNLSGEQAQAAIERELDGRLWSWMRETADPLLKGPVPSPRYRQAMRA
jgi:N-sulfoglucosamine sulfohydrolase